jgi:hypothetical protein
VTQGDGRASLSVVAKISNGVVACFDLMGTMRKVVLH